MDSFRHFDLTEILWPEILKWNSPDEDYETISYQNAALLSIKDYKL